MNIAKASSKLFGASSFNTLVGFAGVTFFARELGASQMGVFFLFEAVLGVLSLVADFGLRGAVEKRISEGQSGGEVLSTALVMKLVPVAAIVVVVGVFRQEINAYVGADVAFLLLIGLVLQELGETQQMVLSGEQRVGQMALPDTARQIGWVGVGALLVLQGYGITGLIYGLFVGYGVMFLWSWHRASSSLRRPSVACGRSLLDFSKYHVVSKAQGYVYSWMDVAIIGFFLTPTAVGAYEIAWRITEAIVLLSNSLAVSILPKISEWHTRGLRDRIGALVSDVTVPSLVLVIPAFGGAVVLSREVLTFVFGPEFAVATLVLVILSGEKIVQALYRLFHRSLHGIDRPDLAARTIVVTLFVNLLLNLLLIRPLGIEGIAVATTVSFALGAFLHWRYFTRYVPIEFPVRELAWCVVSTGIMVLVLGGLRLVLPVDSVVPLLLLIVLGAIVYLLSLTAYSPLRTRLIADVRDVVS
jgi:O-antigen/teichoic acid export membrane protein